MSDQAPARNGRTAALSWALTITFNIIAPLVTLNQLTHHGVSEFNALLISGLWSVVDMAIYIAWHRRVDEFAVMTLVFLAISAVVALVGPHSARLLLVKDSGVTGLIGLFFLATLAAPRPLMFYTGRKFATDGTREAIERWNALWELPGFRRVQRMLTLGWGLGFIVEAVTRIGLSYRLTTTQMATVNSVLTYVFLGVLILWTITYAKRARAKGAAAAAAAAAAEPAEV
ncbi:VC0807 family protein [Kitasatospora aureofaciens]|uniref:VC0807 family protein n=1 Tax=Kitasatospora aureofaciens TaxID=1894 RepID=UPI0038001107